MTPVVASMVQESRPAIEALVPLVVSGVPVMEVAVAYWLSLVDQPVRCEPKG